MHGTVAHQCISTLGQHTYSRSAWSGDTKSLIYQTSIQQKIGRTVISTQNLEFINMDVSGGCDQISHQVSAHVHNFLSYPELSKSVRELYNNSILLI